MDEANDLPALAIATPKVYERHAERFDCERPKSLVERAWLSRFLSLLPDSARILDAGCGAGVPIAIWPRYCLRKSGRLSTAMGLAAGRYRES
jgi:hypothetical protein